MIERGFNPGVVDGIYGANTTSAVEQFQREKGLIVDGKTGPETWDALCTTPPIIQQTPPATTTAPPQLPPTSTPPGLPDFPPLQETCGDFIDNNLNGVVDGSLSIDYRIPPTRRSM